MHDSDVVDRFSEQDGQFGPERIDPLRVGPDIDMFPVRDSHRARRGYGRMGLVGLRVVRGDPSPASETTLDAIVVASGVWLRGEATERGERVDRQCQSLILPTTPAGQGRGRPHHGGLVLGDDEHETSIPYHCADAGHLGDTGGVELCQLGVVGRGQYSARMQHALELEFLDERTPSGKLGDQVRSWCRYSKGVAPPDRLVLDQFAEGESTGSIHVDLALGHDDRGLLRDPACPNSTLQERTTEGDRGHRKAQAALLHRPAAGVVTLVGTRGGGRGLHRNPLDLDSELGRHDLAECEVNALSEL